MWLFLLLLLMLRKTAHQSTSQTPEIIKRAELRPQVLCARKLRAHQVGQDLPQVRPVQALHSEKVAEGFGKQ